MSHDRHKEIASNGGKKAHKLGKAHEWGFAEAQKAGRLGGLSISSHKEHMAEIGRKGANSRASHYSK